MIQIPYTQSLKAAPKRSWNIFCKTSVLNSRLIASYGNVLLKPFIRKNIFSENSQKKIRKGSSLLVTQPATLRFSLVRS